jgi:hypothetical protein
VRCKCSAICSRTRRRLFAHTIPTTPMQPQWPSGPRLHLPHLAPPMQRGFPQCDHEGQGRSWSAQLMRGG